MNLEQLERANELRKEISDLNRDQKELVENYKKYLGTSEGKGLSISFRICERSTVVSLKLDEDTRSKAFNLLNNYLMAQIKNKEQEFRNL